MKLKYIIDINCFLPNSGGIVALHKLCHDLRKIGEESYVLSRQTHPLIDAPFLGDKRFSQQETVVVYPEIVAGNPHNCRNVVRWILNTPGKCSNSRIEDFYSLKKPTDLLFKYSEYFHLRDESESKGLLTTTFIDTDIFYRGTDTQRSGSAFMIKKGGASKIIHPDNSVNISMLEHDWTAMANIFRKIETFYCYDNASYWAFLAALCGCTSIVQPDSNMLFEEWSDMHDHMKYGVAYGLEHVDHAKKTLDLVPQTIKNTSERYLRTVKNFVEVCEKTFLI
jgi:hypothetical protein